MRSFAFGALMFGAFAALAPAGAAAHEGRVCGVGCDQRDPEPLDAKRPLDRLAIRGMNGGVAFRNGGGLEDGSIVDLLVVYSPQAADQNGGAPGIESMILGGLAELNTAAADSLVATTFRIVHMQEVAHTQSGSMSTQLNRLREPGDGVLDEVHDLRDAFKADLVMLVISAGDVCGIANVGVGPGNTPTPQNAFSVVSATCLTAPVSAFAHEVGHNMGLLHGYEENPCTNGGSRFGKGYEDPGGVFGTVMGVGPGPRVLRFSNPNADLNGLPTGVAAGGPNAADAASALALAAPVVARYRDRDLNANGIEDSVEIANGDLMDCDGNGYPDFADQDFNRNGVPDACDIALATSADADGDGVPDEAEAARIYVDDDASGAGTGLSWADAMTDLQDALSLARASGDIDEIWIAEGLYLPASNGHRATRFDLVGGVSLYGGFAGNETALDQRIDGAHPTVLSGDLNQDDLPDPRTPAGIASRQDNTLNVVFLFEEVGMITLDGLIIEHGNADFEVNCGGFTNSGGGMVGFGGDLTIRNCEFRNNSAVNTAALILVSDVRSAIIGSRFVNNSAVDGLFFGSTYPTAGAIFYDGYIGAIRLNTLYDGVDNQFVGNLVAGNRDAEGSPGMLITASQPLFANNILRENVSTSTVTAAGLSLILCEGIEITNSTIVNNSAPNGFGSRSSGIASNRSQVIISNSIIYGNTSGSVTDQRAQFSQSGAGVDVQFINSIVEGWSGSFAGINTSGADPMFVDIASGDVSLLQGSPAIDAGDNTRVPIDAFDLDGDGDFLEPLSRDFLGGARFFDDPQTVDTGAGFAEGSGPIVDIGAIEAAGAAVCPTDLDGSGAVDVFDTFAFLDRFDSGDAQADLDGSGGLEAADVLLYLQEADAGCP